MKSNEDAYETLYLFFNIDGMPPKLIMDGSKEKTVG